MATTKSDSWLIRYNVKKILGSTFPDFVNEITYINMSRTRVLCAVMSVLFIALIILDFIYYQSGRWDISQGYRIIFFSHCSALFLLIFFSWLLFYFKPVHEKNQIGWYQKSLTMIMYNMFLIHMAFIATGDVLKDGSIAAYIGSIFAISGFVFTSNFFSLQLLLTNLLLMVFLLQYAGRLSGEYYSIQIMNSIIYTVFCFILSRILFYYQVRDFKNRKFIQRQKDQLEKLAMRDHLTGILNRRSFLEIVKKEIFRSTRYNRSTSLIMLDIDFFKKVNDKYGHAVGDDVLVYTTRLISDNIRQNDIFARWGGEEFVILSIETDLEQIRKIAENLRKLVEQNVSESRPGVTASFGITSYKMGETIDKMINRADIALYKAKADGRNCVIG